MLKPTNHTKPGAVSMITVILMSIILMVLVIGLLQLMVNEQRQSSDNELTNRAYYAAESGLTSAREYLRTADITALPDDLADAECLEGPNVLQGGQTNLLINDAGYETEVVCQRIARVSSYEDSSSDSTPFEFEDSTDRVLLRWELKTGTASDRTNFRTNTELPQLAGWGTDTPALVRLQLTTFEPGVDLSGSNREYYLVPSDSGTNAINYATTSTSAPIAVQCDDSVAVEEYMCSVSITNVGGKRTFIRITNLYTTASRNNLTAFDASNNQQSDLASQVIVDVTAKVGDIFRRVQARVNLETSISDRSERTVPQSDLPDFTLVGNQLCKDFRITDNDAEFDDSKINTGIDDFCVIDGTP